MRCRFGVSLPFRKHLCRYINKYISWVLYILHNNLNNFIVMHNRIVFLLHYKRTLKALSSKALKLFLLNIFRAAWKWIGMVPHVRMLFVKERGGPGHWQSSVLREGGRRGQGNLFSLPRNAVGHCQEAREVMYGVFMKDTKKRAGPCVRQSPA